MNGHDFAILRDFTRRTAGVIDHVRRLARLQPGHQDPRPVLAEIEDLERAIEAFVDELADREAASWGRTDHAPRHTAPERVATKPLPLSSEVEPHARVTRHGIDGRPKDAPRAAPRPSGKWTQWRSERKA